ncbi:MAG: GDP-fucose synthetase [Flavobacteriaceae bacterium]|nr:GDP-fucose synthetase [Flavobacteriaceae bacterium]
MYNTLWEVNLKVLIFGSNGLVGSSIKKVFEKNESKFETISSTRKDADLLSLTETKNFITKIQPNLIINSAAKVGGIHANNTERSEFLIQNVKINLNILESLIDFPNIQLINLGSSCIYPLEAENPIKEEAIMTGSLEPTNSPYAMAKLTAIELGNSISSQYGNKILNLMPTNLYGPNDNFSDKESHVIPALIQRIHNAKVENLPSVEVWGTGSPMREFLYVDDLSNAIMFLINNNITHGLLNVGSGKEITIKELVEKIKVVVDFQGEIVFNKNYPDGNPRKLIDSSKINELGWKTNTNIEEGLKYTYEWYLRNK